MIYDVTIIGGGIIGCAIARELMGYDLKVILLEKEIEVGFGVSKANSGIIHGGHHGNPDTLKGSLDWRGNQLWDQLSEDLGFGFERIGEVTVAMTEAQMPVIHHLLEQGQNKGVTGLEIWKRDRLLKEEPNLSPEIWAGLYAPTTGVINPYEACFNLIENAVNNGLKLLSNCEVKGLELLEDDEVWLIKTSKLTIASHFILNAAGLYADEIAKMAGVGDFSIKPRKGEEYLLDKRLKGFVKRVIFPSPTPVSKGILVIPTYDGTLMVGPTAKMIEDKTDVTTSFAGAEEVFSKVTKVVPGISAKDCIAEFAGLRPVADGEDFIIGTTSKKGFINVAGIQSPGLTAAPSIALMIMDILREEGLSLVAKEDFNPKISKPIHFMSLSTEEQRQLIEKDPRYGRMVCRCEGITEGEIVDAIHRSARTLDGLKFRTRAGMGRCQGGFCTGRCLELIHEITGIPIEKITKRGGNSWVVCQRQEEKS